MNTFEKWLKAANETTTTAAVADNPQPLKKKKIEALVFCPNTVVIKMQ